MPETGRLDPASVPAISGSGAPATPWTVPGASIHMATFEVRTDAALGLLPSMFSRPAPTYARVYVVDYPESPLGAYQEALLLISCRYLMLPRQYLVASVVTSEAARDANAQNSHYTSEVGSITTTRDGDTITSTITTPSGLDVTVTSPAGVPTGPEVLRYDPVVVVQPGDNGPRALTVSAAPENIQDALISSGTVVAVNAAPSGTPWDTLRPVWPITGTFARLDIEVPEAKEIELPPMMAAAAARASS